MKILGVSGGPDSMLLLHKYKNKKIIVAHVNYNMRKDSKNDEKIVEDFCKDHDIPFFKLDLNDKPNTNFQKWARDKRFDFFKKLFDKYQCKELILGHHKDDFLETAIMQLGEKRNPDQFGIKKVAFVKDMKIVRPFIDKYWKKEVLDICEYKTIKYAIDSTNAEAVYKRNKVRQEIAELSDREKNNQYAWFKMSNKILLKKNLKIEIYYRKWLKSKFSLFTFGYMKFKSDLVFRFLHHDDLDINVTSKKIESIIQWIESNNGNTEYKIKESVFIIKDNKRIKIITKNK